ncbi:hypothetical protein D3C81_2009340 [compost metagenome]
MRHHIDQQAEFPWLQAEWAAASFHAARQQIDLQVFHAQFAYDFIWLCPAQQRFDSRRQFREGEGLGQVIVAAGLQAAYTLVNCGQRAQY